MKLRTGTLIYWVASTSPAHCSGTKTSLPLQLPSSSQHLLKPQPTSQGQPKPQPYSSPCADTRTLSVLETYFCPSYARMVLRVWTSLSRLWAPDRPGWFWSLPLPQPWQRLLLHCEWKRRKQQLRLEGLREKGENSIDHKCPMKGSSQIWKSPYLSNWRTPLEWKSLLNRLLKIL